jgi:hypothetical protein
MKYVKGIFILFFLINIVYTLNQCGISKPSEENDCFSYSSQTTSCCYYSYFSKKGCVSYNGLHNGKVIYGGLLVSCSSSQHLAYSLLMTLLFIILN